MPIWADHHKKQKKDFEIAPSIDYDYYDPWVYEVSRDNMPPLSSHAKKQGKPDQQEGSKHQSQNHLGQSKQKYVYPTINNRGYDPYVYDFVNEYMPTLSQSK